MAERLSSACRNGNLDTVKKVVNERIINSRNDLNYTPLNVACYYGNIDIVKFLLDSGADIKKDNGQGWTPLHAASMQGNTGVVRLLLDNGAACVVNVTGTPSFSSSANRNHTPLLTTCRSKCDPNGVIVQLLIDAGADVNVRSAQGRTALMEASVNGFHKKVEYLLKAGADVHAMDTSGFRALHMAVPFFRVVKLLIDFGAEVNVMDSRNEIPLQRRNISPEVICLLLEHGAGADIPCIRHKTCKSSIAWCLYKSSRASAKRERSTWGSLDRVRRIEKYLIKLDVAGLCSGQILEPLDLNHWDMLSRDDFKAECQTELVMMKTGKIPGSNATYLDALLQRPHALKLVEPPSLEHCREKFHIYGELIWSRFLSGRRRLPLIDECTDFFSVAEDVPFLPPECVEEILCYLPERDLKTLLAIYKSVKRRPSTPETKKRANPDSPLRVMKHLKV